MCQFKSARDNGVKHLYSIDLADNSAMRALAALEL